MLDRRAIAIAVTFFSAIGAVSGEDRIVSRADEIHLRLVAHEPKIEAAQVRLKDGTEIAGKYASAERRGLRLIPDQLIPYDQIATIRLDLGRDRTWRTVFGIIGGIFIGAPIGVLAGDALDKGRHQTAGAIVPLPVMAAGAYAGQRLGGIRHKWITIVVQ